MQIDFDHRNMMAELGQQCTITVNGTDFHIQEPAPFHPATSSRVTVCTMKLECVGWIVWVNGPLDCSQNYALHFICITFHLHYISFAFKNHATSARNA